jgi:hypothetical protein
MSAKEKNNLFYFIISDGEGEKAIDLRFNGSFVDAVYTEGDKKISLQKFLAENKMRIGM